MPCLWHKCCIRVMQQISISLSYSMIIDQTKPTLSDLTQSGFIAYVPSGNSLSQPIWLNLDVFGAKFLNLHFHLVHGLNFMVFTGVHQVYFMNFIILVVDTVSAYVISIWRSIILKKQFCLILSKYDSFFIRVKPQVSEILLHYILGRSNFT